MKKLITIILCVITLFSLSGCMTTETKRLKKQYEKDAVPIAIQYIESKYGFKPKVLEANAMTYTEYFSTTVSNNVIIKMSHNGKEFTTFLDGEEEDNVCYDSYEADTIEKLLKDYFKDKIKGDIEVNVIFGNRSFNEELEREFVIKHKLNNNDIWTALKNNGAYDLTNVFIKMSEPISNLSYLTRNDLKEFFDLEEHGIRLHIINFRDKTDYDKISTENYFYNQFSDYDLIGLYATEVLYTNKEDPKGKTDLVYEKYTLEKAGNVLFAYTGNAISNIDETFTLDDLPTDIKTKVANNELMSSKVNIKFNNFGKMNKVYVYSKLEKPIKNETEDYKYDTVFLIDNNYDVYWNNYKKGYYVSLTLTKGNNVEMFVVKDNYKN